MRKRASSAVSPHPVVEYILSARRSSNDEMRQMGLRGRLIMGWDSEGRGMTSVMLRKASTIARVAVRSSGKASTSFRSGFC
eukprot:500277-Rhodomonas_salina.5